MKNLAKLASYVDQQKGKRNCSMGPANASTWIGRYYPWIINFAATPPIGQLEIDPITGALNPDIFTTFYVA